MNPNPNRNSRHHHQQLPTQGSVAGGGNNNNVLVYINQQQQQAGVDLGGLSNISQNSNPMPPSGWVKSHSSSHHLQQGNGISSSNSNCSPVPLSAGSMSTSYGASNSFNSQHQFYSGQSRQQQTDIRYSGGNNGGTNHVRPNPNYNNLSSSNGMFYPVENQSNADSCQYYQQDNNFQFDHTQMKTSSCDMSNGNEGVSSNNSNFYGFYPQNSHSYHQQPDYQNQMGSATSTGNNSMGDDTDYNRVLHQQQHYHNSHHHQQQHSNVQNQQGHNNSLPVSVQDYFGLPSSSTENSSGRHNPNYGHQLHHQHHHSTPFRRNSIESYSSEPGDLSYNAKYACNFPSTQFNSQTNSGMTKRDSMSNMSMSVPNCNSQWSRDTNIVNGPVEQCHTGNNSHGYFFNSHSQQNQSHRHFSNVNVNQNNLSTNFHQQQMQSFKSCSFEQQELRLEDMKPDGQVSTVGTSTKAAAVKHRSLSLSLPSSSYSRSDIGFHSHLHDQEGNLVHSHLNNSNNLSINPFDEIESNSNVVPVPVNQNSDHTSQCKLGNCVNRVDNINGDNRTSVQCDNFSPNNDADARLRQEIVESQNLVETTTLSSCPSSQSNFSNSEVSNSDSIVSACSNFPEVVTSVLEATNCKSDGLSRDDGSKTDVSLISTTTNDIGNHVDNESETDPNNSSSSCGLGLFGHSNSVSNLTLIVGDSDDSESCMSGISSFSGSNNTKISPQKISKRSFSEADKDLVINTTAVSFGGRGTVIIPKGWKRESSSSQQMENIIFYISPSGTKLRTWDELKNYICSDGTCKCGLSCPLRLEHAFSFDPKVTNLCQEEEESLLNLNETGSETRLLCNHKRKIPKSEDSPLISSTRDDLGDCGEKKSKKRRTSGSGGLNENLTSISLPKSSPSITSGHHVPVPFSQQSPDTTTQTPQTDMSPASSVSSEPSSATIFSSAGGNGGSRSTNSTPTPTSSASSSRNVSTPPGKGQAQCGFAWPPPPTSQAQQTATFWPNTTTNNTNSGNTATTSAGKKNASAPAKKPGYQHHLIPKVAKRSASPCPNIDVRQIPLEQNRPPPRQTPISIRNAPAAGASHPNQNPNLSFFPITSSHGDELNLNTMNLNMNTGYSISPIPNTTNNANTLQFAPTVVNANNNANTLSGNSMPIQIQRVITGTNPGQTTNALLPQALPSSITISMVNQQPQQQPTTTTAVNTVPSGQNVATSSETVSEKSPLQLVQDVVNRFHSSPKTEEGSGAVKEVVNGSAEPTPVTNANRKEQSSATSSSPVGSSTPNEPTTTPIEVENGELEIQIPATSSSANVTSTINSSKTKSDDDSIRIIAETIGNKTNGAVSIVEVTNSSEAKSVAPSPSLSAASATIVSGVPLISNTTSMTTTTSSTGTVPIMTAMCAPMASSATNTIINCATTTTTSNANTLTLNALSNLSALSGGTNQPLILQQSTDQSNGQNSTFLTATSAGPQSLRYPIFQTIQPFFLNSTGAPGGSLIISPQSQPHQTETLGQQSFIYDHQSHAQHQTTTDGIQPMLQQTTMVLDPNVCGNTGGIVGGPKKKKKRLSKKQQQQQAQLQLQQQLLLQQLHQQAQQQQAAATIPLTIFPQSFNLGNLGHQGFSLQPMNMNMNMNFFPTPTILTLPNLILNPADGTLFIQPSTPLSAAQQTVKLGQFPLAAAPQQSVQQPNLIAPKKDIITTTASTTTILSSDLLKTSPTSGDIGSDDSRQNATPDSSTNDLQLSLSVTNPSQPNSITLSLQPHTTTIGTTNSQKKIAVKSKAVSSSSSAVKRVFTQKQILPKIDSTTPSVENG